MASTIAGPLTPLVTLVAAHSIDQPQHSRRAYPPVYYCPGVIHQELKASPQNMDFMRIPGNFENSNDSHLLEEQHRPVFEPHGKMWVLWAQRFLSNSDSSRVQWFCLAELALTRAPTTGWTFVQGLNG